MERRLRLAVLPLVALFVALPAVAEANELTSPESWFALAVLMIVMMAVTALSGGYVLLREVKKEKRSYLASIIFGIIALFISGFGQTFLGLAFIAVALLALVRALYLVRYANMARPEAENVHLAQANAARLRAAGLILLIFVVLAFYTLAATTHSMTYFMHELRAQGDLEEFLAFQFDQADKSRRETGEARFVPQEGNRDSQGLKFGEQHMFADFVFDEKEWEVVFAVNDDLTAFTVQVTPKEFLGFPFNYIDTRPAFYADQTGVLRKINVSEYRLCPPDAPAVPMRVFVKTPAPTE